MLRKLPVLLGLTLTFPMLAQKNNLKDNKEYKPTKSDVFFINKSKDGAIFDKAGGDVIFAETFSSIGNWTTSDVDGAIWLHDMDGPNGQFSNPATQKITSTTADNGFMIFDADFSNAASPYVNRVGSLVSPAIDLSTNQNILVSFEHSYRFCCSRDFFPKLELSTDDFTTFETIDVGVPGVSTNKQAGTVKTIVNIREFLTTSSNLANFKVRFNFDGAIGASHYFWQVDDFKLIEQHENDLAIANSWLGDIVTDFEVTEVPAFFNKNLTVQVALKNYGFATPADVALNVKVLNSNNEEVFNQSGGTLYNNFLRVYDTITYETGLNLGSLPVGTYKVEMSINLNGTDGDLTNNQVSRTVLVTENTLSSINYDGFYYRESVAYNYRDAAANTTPSMQVGSLFYVPENAGSVFLTGLDLGFSVGPTTYPTTIGEPLIVNIWEYDNSPDITNFGDRFILMSNDYEFTLNANQLNSDGSLASFDFSLANNTNVEPLVLTGGKSYYASFLHNGGENTYLWYWASFLDEDYSSIMYGPFGTGGTTNWFTIGYDPFIKMNFQRGVGLNEVSNEDVSFNLFPNPSQNETKLNFNLGKESSVSIEVTDISGKVVATYAPSLKMKGNNSINLDTRNYENGMYLVKLITENKQFSKKLLISK